MFWPLFLASSERLRNNRRMTDAAHNQHSETRRPSDRYRIVTTGRSRSSPPVQKCCAEMMSVSVAGIQKNRCRTTVAEPIGETRAELPFTGDKVGLFRAQRNHSAAGRRSDKITAPDAENARTSPRSVRIFELHVDRCFLDQEKTTKYWNLA
jgi:hypothetical protein